jgi:hypothetical protein
MHLKTKCISSDLEVETHLENTLLNSKSQVPRLQENDSNVIKDISQIMLPYLQNYMDYTVLIVKPSKIRTIITIITNVSWKLNIETRARGLKPIIKDPRITLNDDQDHEKIKTRTRKGL